MSGRRHGARGVVRIVALCGLIAAARAHGFAGGASGYSAKGGKTCSECHSGGREPTVELKGPATLTGGDTGSYEVIITGATKKVPIFGGLDVAASGGELKAKSKNTVLKDGEVVQSAILGPAALPANLIEIKFDFVAPAGAGIVTLFAAGLASDGSGGAAGDSAKVAQLQVTVQVPPDLARPPEDLAGVDLLGLDLAVPPDLAVPADLTPPPEEPPPADLAVHRPDEPRWGCGCALGGRSAPRPPIGCLLFLGGGLAIWLRRGARLARSPFAR